jgi:hypothetical protein
VHCQHMAHLMFDLCSGAQLKKKQSGGALCHCQSADVMVTRANMSVNEQSSPEAIVNHRDQEVHHRAPPGIHSTATIDQPLQDLVVAGNHRTASTTTNKANKLEK